MSIFNFNLEELLTFFAVLVRFSAMVSVLPFVGDRLIPASVKILFSLVLTISLFPSLVISGQVNPREAVIWSATTGGIATTIGLEVLCALALGYSARLIFEGISFGANLVGNFMGFGSASTYDPHQESQTQIIAQIQTALAMLLFLALNGHYLMLKVALESYRIVGLGKAVLGASLGSNLIQMTGELFRFGIQLAAPVALSIFAVNVVFGVLSKAMPQFNIFSLSMTISALIGFIVLYFEIPEFVETSAELLAKMTDWMSIILLSLSGRK